MSSKLTIKTDNKWKNFKYRYEVPKKVLKSQFDYQKEDEVSDGYFKHHGSWYHLDMFMRIEGLGDPQLKGWDGYHGDSYFSGVLIKVSKDGEQYKVATYIS